MFLGIATDTWVILAVLVAGLGAITYEYWLPSLQTGSLSFLNWWKAKPPVITEPVKEDTDVLDLRAAKRLQLRFQAAKCKEGLEAMQTVFEHFFHGDVV